MAFRGEQKREHDARRCIFRKRSDPNGPKLVTCGLRGGDQKQRRDVRDALSAALRAETEAILDGVAPPERPRTRADCASVPRPCPFVSCRHHLYLDVTSAGSVRMNFPHLEPGDLPPECSCSLDVAERCGSMSFDEIAPVLNLTGERVRQLEELAVENVARSLRRVGIKERDLR